MKLLSTLFAASLAALGLAGCSSPGSSEVRYKVTVEVDDGTILRAGSSVWSWTLSKPTLALASAYDGRFEGEAIFVDLGNGRKLFAVLRGAAGDEGAVQMIPERLFGDIGRSIRGENTQFSGDRVKDLRNIASRTGERQELNCEVRPDWCPMLVTFRNVGDPKTVEAVDPQALDRSFGPGLRLRRVFVELTDEPVTRGLGEQLKWIPTHAGALMKRPKDVAISDMPLAGRLHDGDFSQ